MTSDPRWDEVPTWLKEPSNDGGTVYVAIGSNTQLSDEAREAIETLARELAETDTEGHRMMLGRCPCQLPKSLLVCGGNRRTCTIHLTGSDR